MVKPAFVVAGAQRAGTTFLWSLLRQHASIYVPAKELHLFCGAPCRMADCGTYSQIFEECPAGRLAGDFTPDYMFFPWVPSLMRDVLGEVPIVVLLRDPVDRAFSHYCLERRQGREWRSFESAIRAESQRIVNVRTGIRNASYVQRGMYAEQITRLYEYFGRDRVMVLDSEELFRDSAGVLAKVCRHIGVEVPSPVTAGDTVRNEALRPEHDFVHRGVTVARIALGGRPGTSKLRTVQRRVAGSGLPAIIPAATRLSLGRHFQSSNEELRRLTGLELCGWTDCEAGLCEQP